MGRGNVCTHGPYEGLYYASYGYIHVYTRYPTVTEFCDVGDSKLLNDCSMADFNNGYEYDSFLSDGNFEEFLDTLQNDLRRMFKSLDFADYWFDRESRCILENSLFAICLVDNEWSCAVTLRQKESDWQHNYAPLQKRHYQTYLDGIKAALFQQFPVIYGYGGPWTSQRLERPSPSADPA